MTCLQAASDAAAEWLRGTGAACRGVCPGDAYVCRLLAEWKTGAAHALDLRTGGPQILRQLETVYDGGARRPQQTWFELLLRSICWLRSKV